MKKNLFFIVLILSSLSIILSSCTKNEYIDNYEPINNNLNPDTPAAEEALFPMSPDSWWLYEDNGGSSQKLTATSRDTSIDADDYTIFTMQDETSGSETPWYFSKGEKYYKAYINIVGSNIPLGTGSSMSIIISTLDPKVGDTWHTNTTLQLSGLFSAEVTATGSVESVSNTVTIKGETYDNAVKTHNILKATIQGLPNEIDAGTIDITFVKGIGIVEYEMNISVMSFINQSATYTLQDFEIAK